MNGMTVLKNRKENETPIAWAKHLRRKKSPHAAAIFILTELLNLERRGGTKGGAIQTTYEKLAERWGLSKWQAANAVHYLAEKGLMQLEFRTLVSKDGLKSNVLFIRLNIKKIAEISA